MPRRRLINGVLDGFLGNLVSRYSEWHGYWLLGFLAVDRRSLEIDLLRSTCHPVDDLHEGKLLRIASRKFSEQLAKWRIPVAWVADARLDVIWSGDVVNGFVGSVRQDGYEVTFAASVKTDIGRTISRVRRVFAAPHNPRLERPSARAA